jgi:cytochrome P450
MTQAAPITAFRSPPGPRAWPVLGHLLGVRAAGDFLSYLDPQWRAHGDVFRFQVLGRNAVVLAHPEAMKQVLSTRRDRYTKGSVYDGVRRVMGDGVLTLESDGWKRRRAILQPTFHRQSLAKLAVIMVESGARFFDELTLRAAKGSIAVDAHREMVKLTLAVVIDALFGRGLATASDVSYEALGAALELMGEEANGIPVPSWLPTPHNRKFQRTMRELDGVVYGLIAAARKRGTVDGSPKGSVDGADDGTLLSMLLSATDEETGQPLSDRAIRDEVFTLFVAGHETTALTMTWLFVMLDGRPEILARMQEEVRGVLGGREPGFDDVPKFPYVRQVIDEILRLRPPAPLVPRNVMQDDEIGGYRVKAGEMAFLLFWATHRHPDYWTRPEAFDPDRFSAEQSKGRHSWSYVPFSGGPRTCVGNMFALVESTLLLAQLLSRFDLDIQSCADVRPVAVATLRPSKAVGVVLRPRARA